MEVVNLGLPHHITVTAETIQKFTYILDAKYNLEFTAFCHAEKRPNGEYHIFDIFFPRQDNTGITTECDSEDVMDLITEGADISMLSGHIHSHVDMPVFTSGTDEKDIKERAAISGWNASLIMNKKGEIFGHIVDLETGIYVKKCPVTIIYPFTAEKYEADLMAKIKECDKLEDVKTLARFSYENYHDMHFPLSESDVYDLEDTIKNKFKYKRGNYGKSTTTTTTKSTGKKNNPPVIPIHESVVNKYLDDNVFEGNEVPSNPYDWFSMDEMQTIQDARLKSYHDMTEYEFKLIEEYNALYGDNSWLFDRGDDGLIY